MVSKVKKKNQKLSPKKKFMISLHKMKTMNINQKSFHFKLTKWTLEKNYVQGNYILTL